MTYEPITATEARGDSPALPREALDALASLGETILSRRDIREPIGEMGIAEKAWKEVQSPWGGATINIGGRIAHLVTLDTGYAVSIGESVTLPLDASVTDIETAIRKVSGDTVHVGVFRDEDLQRIDVDPVFVARNAIEAYAVGVARHATGGAYNFATGNALWIPHLAE
jgi:hypothetical protein